MDLCNTKHCSAEGQGCHLCCAEDELARLRARETELEDRLIHMAHWIVEQDGKLREAKQIATNYKTAYDNAIKPRQNSFEAMDVAWLACLVREHIDGVHGDIPCPLVEKLNETGRQHVETIYNKLANVAKARESELPHRNWPWNA